MLEHIPKTQLIYNAEILRYLSAFVPTVNVLSTINNHIYNGPILKLVCISDLASSGIIAFTFYIQYSIVVPHFNPIWRYELSIYSMSIFGILPHCSSWQHTRTDFIMMENRNIRVIKTTFVYWPKLSTQEKFFVI